MIKLIEAFVYLLGVFSTVYILKIENLPIFFWLCIILFVLIILSYKKISTFNNKNYMFYLLSICITTVIALVKNENSVYTYTACISFVVIFIVSFCGTQLNVLRDSVILKYVSGLKVSCIIHLIWCFAQYLFYEIWQIDINNIIFVNLLHSVDIASRYNNGGLVITGFCWHPSNLVPVIILSVILINKWYIWLAAFFVTFNTHSTTLIITILVCFFLMEIRHFGRITNMLSKGLIGKLIISVLLIIIILINNNLLEVFLDKFQLVFTRINGNANDMSTLAHISYYTKLPVVWGKMSILNILFGIGLGCSGVCITQINGQYNDLGAWVVESDPMNLIYSCGIIGTILFYCWIIKTMYNGYKIDYKYFVLILALIISGITYNIQYDWVILVELVFVICIKRNINIFNYK